MFIITQQFLTAASPFYVYDEWCTRCKSRNTCPHIPRVHTDLAKQNSLTFPWFFPDANPNFPDKMVVAAATCFIQIFVYSYSLQLLNFERLFWTLQSFFLSFSACVFSKWLFNKEIYRLSNYFTHMIILLYFNISAKGLFQEKTCTLVSTT